MATEQAKSALAEVQMQELGDLSSLLKKEFKPRTDTAEQAVESAVQTLAQQALANTALVKDDVVQSIEAMISALDAKIGKQLDKILHHPDFQQLEGAWRGLHYLVNNTETDETLKIRVLNVSKKDLGKTFSKFKGTAWDQSPLFKQLYEQEFGQLGGHPYGLLVGDYQFDQSPPDVEIMRGMAQVAAAAHAPFLASPKPSLFQMESWQELANPRDLTKIFQTPEYAAWRSFRQSDDSKYIGLAMPRFLARLPYGANTMPAEGMTYEEESLGGKHEQYVWANAAYAMAANITRSFKQYGWCTSIRGVESGGAVANLPSHTFATDDGGVDMKCPTEIAISDRREAELAKNGLMALVHRKNSDFAAFISANSIHQPAEYEDAAASANAALGSRLPYMFATCRFAHYLKCIVRDKVGGFASAASMQQFLQSWILNYVDGDPEGSSEMVKATHPLAGAEVVVTENKSNPGYYSAQFFLRPHYQLEGLNISLRLVSELPSQRAA
ncbi:MAG: type VI secretion system contractile sheath large subunit [Rubrivivax sp.]|jgi:type VI secretion system protein ImpC|nr:type VI secretion system contractile sheath large subunit [Rubrivivax sp.]